MSMANQEMTIGIAAFDRLIKMLLMRIDRLEAQLQSSKRAIQPTTTVIKGAEYYDVYALSQLFGVTIRTIYRWRDEGLLALTKMGSKYYIEAHELTMLMTQNFLTEPAR